MFRTTAIVVACGVVLRTFQSQLMKLQRRKANCGKTITSPDEAGAEAFKLTNSRNVQLYCRKWGTVDSAQAAVVFLHSELLDSRHFRLLAEDLSSLGCVCYGLDLTGFGKSGYDKSQSHIEHFGDYIDDLQTLIAHIRSENESVRLVLYGEDLGATIALAYGMDYPDTITAIAASSVKLEGRKVNEGMFSFLSKVFHAFPAPPEQLEYEIEELYDDGEVIVAAKENFEKLQSASYRKVSEISVLCDYVKNNAAKLTMPLMLLHGRDDRRNRLELVEVFKDQASSTTKYLRPYPGTKHGMLYGEENRVKSIRKEIMTFVQKTVISSES
eukprot:g4962.t1